MNFHLDCDIYDWCLSQTYDEYNKIDNKIDIPNYIRLAKLSSAEAHFVEID